MNRVAPNEIEHDVVEGNLMRWKCGQNQKTSKEPKQEPDILGLYVEEKDSSLSVDGPYCPSNLCLKNYAQWKYQLMCQKVFPHQQGLAAISIFYYICGGIA